MINVINKKQQSIHSRSLVYFKKTKDIENQSYAHNSETCEIKDKKESFKIIHWKIREGHILRPIANFSKEVKEPRR